MNSVTITVLLGLLQNVSPDSTDFNCLTYQKINGTIKKWDYDKCSIGNHCCFSSLNIDQSGKFIVELGGCQNYLQEFVYQSSEIKIHPIDHLPFIGQFSNEKILEYCEFEMCIGNIIPNNHWRICACHKNNCNEGGINEMLKKYMVVKPWETSTLSLNLFDRDLEIIIDG